MDERAGSSFVPTLELGRNGRKANRSVGLFQPGQSGIAAQRPEPGHKRDQERLARCLGGEVRTGDARSPRVQRRKSRDDDQARDHRSRCQTLDVRRPAGALSGRRGRRDLRRGGARRTRPRCADHGDPTDQAPDKGQSRKAFCGYCMAVVQSTKQGGNITVEATSPGLVRATATLPVKAVTLRPQVAPWEREIPKGEGVTGLWRPVPLEGDSESFAPSPALDSVYSFKQEGNSLTGTVEGTATSFFGGGDVPAPIVNGNIDGSAISFKAGNSNFTGSVKRDRLELRRSASPGVTPNPPEKAPDAPDIGPAPDGSDPSRGPEPGMDV